MKKKIFKYLSCIAVALQLIAANGFADPDQGSSSPEEPANKKERPQDGVMPGEYLIKRRPVAAGARASNPYTFRTLRRTELVEVVQPISQVRTAANASIVTATGPEPYNEATVAADCAEILADRSVERCEPNLVRREMKFPIDTRFDKQWYLHDPDPRLGYDIDAPEGWESSTGSEKVVVAVLDSGINYFHQDLLPNLWLNTNESFNDIDDDSNGYVDDVFGVNTRQGIPFAWDCDGHGTHVAGILGAQGNDGYGIAGVNWNVQIMPLAAAVCEDGIAYFPSDALILAYEYAMRAKDRGVNLVAINASIGGGLRSQAEEDAIKELAKRGIILVAAAGNGGADGLGDNNDLLPSYPANYNSDNIVSVAATDRSGLLARFSNFGPTTVDIAAPGAEIFSCFVSEAVDLPGVDPVVRPNYYNVWASLNGTSMAAPVVTGALALLYSKHPTLTYKQAMATLYNSIRPLDGLKGRVRSPGIVNLKNLMAAQPDLCPEDANKLSPGVCGCGLPDSDSDGDGTLDCQDQCLSDPKKTAPGACGCGAIDSDTDRDGTFDCVDQCPADSGKRLTGACGCGVPDIDSDGNAIADCIDIAHEQPRVVSARSIGSSLSITLLPARPVRAEYVLTVKIAPPPGAGRSKTIEVVWNKPKGTIKNIKKGSRVTINYHDRLPDARTLRSTAVSRPKKVIA